VAADIAQPMLLYTFLGRVSSQAGREFERVLAVEITVDGEPRFYHKTENWLLLADPARAIRTQTSGSSTLPGGQAMPINVPVTQQ
jgi:hypothetical protein